MQGCLSGRGTGVIRCKGCVNNVFALTGRSSKPTQFDLTCQAANKDLPTSLLDGSDAFLEWAKSSGTKYSRLKPAVFSGVRGLAASAAINSEDNILSVPRRVAITLSPRQRCPFPPGWLQEEYWAPAPWFVKIALILLYEKSRGSASTMSTYISQLPAFSDSPVLWDSNLLQTLQYPYLIQLVKEQQAEWSGLYRDLQGATLTGPAALTVSKADFLWAMAIVRSRTFSGPYISSTAADRGKLLGLVAALVVANLALGIADSQKTLTAAIAVVVFNILYELILSKQLKQYAMCPLIDFINHSSQVKSEVSYDYFLDTYSVTTCRSYKPGEQVLVSYGQQSNDSLMQFYGFVEPDNPQDVYTMTNLLKWLDELGPGTAPERSRLDSLNNSGLLPSLQLVTIARTGVPSDTLAALRYLLAPNTEVAARGGNVVGFRTLASDETEFRVATALVHACRRELASLGSSQSDDEQVLAQCTPRDDSVQPSRNGGGKVAKAKGKGFEGSGAPMASLALGLRERSAVLFRLEKKRVLAACLRSLGADVEVSTGSSIVVQDGATV